MSDTPQIYSCGRSLKAMVLFSAKLERELNAANVEIQRLRKANLQLREGAEEQKQRIKRLEDYATKKGYKLQFVADEAVTEYLQKKESK